MTMMQFVFFLMVGITIIIPIIISMILNRIRPGLGGPIKTFHAGIVGDILFDNNARATAFFILAILLTISALIGGFGKPLMDDSVDSVVTSVRNWEPKKLPMPKEGSLLWGVLTRDGEIKITPPVKVENGDTTAVANKESKHYPSWWWWIVAFGSWLFAIVYLPLSRRDEVLQFIEDLWNRRSTIKAEATIPGDEQSGGGGSSSTVVEKVMSTIDGMGNKGNYSFFKSFIANMLNSLVMEKVFGEKKTS
jgi:hypothetical protein